MDSEQRRSVVFHLRWLIGTIDLRIATQVGAEKVE